MEDKENDKNLETYEQEIDESTLSNPFSNALKNLLQKMHLIKSDQKLIGDKETNSRGYQTTSKNPLEATERKSLKAILRTAFEDMQNKRAEKIRAKNATNTMTKYTIGEQGKSAEQTQTVSKDPTHEFIRPPTAAEKAAMRAQANQPAPNLINNTVILAETENEISDSMSAAEIEVDESFTKDSDAKTTTISETSKTPLSIENITIEDNKNKVIIPKQIKNEKTTNEPKSTDDELSM